MLPLEHIRILDLTTIWAGPYATRLLGDMGAEVIKIEWGRGLVAGPPPPGAAVLPESQPGERYYNRNGSFNKLNRNKYGISLNLKTDQGVEIFKKLVKISDVVIENYSARVMENFGLHYPILREINPQILMVSMPGYGMTGPERNYVAYGTSIEPAAGLSVFMGYPGGPPFKQGVAYGDPTAGINAALAIVFALIYRRQAGKGQFIDMSQCEASSCLIGEAILDYTMNQRSQPRMGNQHTSMAPHGVYRCKGEDQWVTISVGSDDEWERLCHAMGNPPWARDEKFSNLLSRWRHREELDRFLEGWTKEYDHYEVMERLQRLGIASGAVLSNREMLTDVHLKEREFFQPVTHPESGTHPYPGIWAKLSETPGTIRLPAPRYGEHNEYVYGELLGFSSEEIEMLNEEEVI